MFYTFEDLTGSEQLSERYANINPMAKYLKDELIRAGVTNREIAALFPSNTGGMTGCVSNWVLGLNFPLKEQYEKIRDYLNKQGEYEYLRREYEDLRRPFNLKKGLTDVWEIDFYKEIIPWHPSPKPVDLLKIIIASTSNKGCTVFDPFAGSGSSIVASQHLGRSCIAIEINSEYCQNIRKRCFNQQFLDRTASYEFLEETMNVH